VYRYLTHEKKAEKEFFAPDLSVITGNGVHLGFLLGGIGELNKNRQPNFLVVDKNTSVSDVEVRIFFAFIPVRVCDY
jgi:hypothetical protein